MVGGMVKGLVKTKGSRPVLKVERMGVIRNKSWKIYKVHPKW